jgi:thiosulfate reductase cytochrome b subunit
MDIGRVSYYSRRVHRVVMLFVIVLGLIQMATGTVMKYPQLFPFVDQTSVRVLHFDVATYFSIAFVIQIVTGVIMYMSPKLIKALRKPSPPPTV